MKSVFHLHPILSFILLTFAITFSAWFLPVLTDAPNDIAFALLLLGGCGPMIAGYTITVVRSSARVRIHSWWMFLVVFFGVSIVLGLRMYAAGIGMDTMNGRIPPLDQVGITAYLLFGLVAVTLALNASNWNNRQLRENYLRSFMFSRKALPWYLLALVLQPLISLSSFLMGRLLGLEVTEVALDFDPFWLLAFFSTLLFFGGNEEFGWRGFLQKELQKRYSPLISTLLISFLWSLWHLPHYYSGLISTGGLREMVPKFVWMLPLTFVFTWFYNRSRYSVLAVVLLHTMNNHYSQAFGSSNRIFVILLFGFCAFAVLHDRMWVKKNAQFSHSRRIKESAVTSV